LFQLHTLVCAHAYKTQPPVLKRW